MFIKTISNHKSQKILKALAIAALVFLLTGSCFMIEPAYTAISDQSSSTADSILQDKIEQYKKFKATYDDKDFRLKGTPVKRMEQGSDTASSYSFQVYHIAYGITEDNFREYNPYSRQIIRNPGSPRREPLPVCESGFFVEENRKSTGTGFAHPKAIEPNDNR